MGAKQQSKITLRDAASACAMEMPLSFEDGSQEIVWIRTPTHAEIEGAQIAKLEYRRQLRERYAKGTAGHAELEATIFDYSEHQLASIIATNEMPALAEKAKLNVPQPMEPDWSRYKTEEEREEATIEHNSRMNEYDHNVREEMRKMALRREEELANSGSLDEMRERVIRITVGQLVNQQTEPAFDPHEQIIRVGFDNEYLIYNSFYREDHETRYFESFEQVQNLNDGTKAFLLQFAQRVNLVTRFDIKNSQGRFDQRTGPAENTQAPTRGHSTPGSQGSSSRKKSSRGGRKQ